MAEALKPVYWVGSSKKDLLQMPDEVIDVFGFALHLAQSGKKHQQAKVLKGFGGAGVLEVVEDHKGYLPRGIHRQVWPKCLRIALFSKEIKARHPNTKTRH